MKYSRDGADREKSNIVFLAVLSCVCISLLKTAGAGDGIFLRGHRITTIRIPSGADETVGFAARERSPIPRVSSACVGD